jgi:predicted Zn-dependent peptidase
MNLINRTIAPDFRPIEKINIQKRVTLNFHDVIPVTVVNAGSEDVIKLDVIFDAGSKYSNHPLVASFTNLMMNEGTHTRKSAELAEAFDFYGAYVHLNADRDFSEVALYTLTKHFEKTLEIFTDILTNPVFPEEEFSVLLENKKQKFLIDEQKVKALAAKKFGEVVFGKENAYGRNASMEDYNSLTVQQLKDFHLRLYHEKNCRVIISGKITTEVLEVFERSFRLNKAPIDQQKPYEGVGLIGAESKLHFVEKSDAVQAAIRIGKATINKHHADYPGLQILNMILGGYFGSRLMMNLREEKGYTYGVGSVVASLKDTGYFTTICEVGADSTTDAVKEIYYEINRLIKEPVPQEELDRVRNYMMGEFVRLFDGPFSQAEAIRSVIDFDLDEDYYYRYLRVLRDITPLEIQELAKKYLDKDSLYEVVAGK